MATTLCSVDWVMREGARRATEVSTTWVPIGETPQTRARSVSGALLWMDALAAATADELRAGLEPLVAGYGAWHGGNDHVWCVSHVGSFAVRLRARRAQ